jgi:3-oxoadipate enol-lactonase
VTAALLDTPHGARLECLVTGAGEPVTVFAHGLGRTIHQTRPLGSGVGGTRVFFSFRGHGRSEAPPSGWGYAELAQDLRAVADAYGATRAVATSLGAGALCRLLADTPDRFARLVFFLPAVLDGAREAGPEPDGLARVTVAGARAGLAATVRREVPLPEGGDVLTAVTAPALVLACEGDPVHPAAVARRLAALLPAARLHVYPEPDVLERYRADLRRRITGFLGGRP